MNIIELTQYLISFPSITPHSCGIFKAIEGFLRTALPDLHIEMETKSFADPQEGGADVENVVVLINRKAPVQPHLGFAGHVDVVPTGDDALWSHPPFSGHVDQENLYGRGACDMKGSIASFLCAVVDFFSHNPKSPLMVSLLLTADEEGPARAGTVQMLPLMLERGWVPQGMIVGEPTSISSLGDTLKIGRRGSLNGLITLLGTGGHVAYPHLTDNPIHRLPQILNILKTLFLDDGTNEFQPSHLEITSVGCNNQATNVIPSSVSIQFNVRFNPLHTAQRLQETISNALSQTLDPNLFKLDWTLSALPFVCTHSSFIHLVSDAVYELTKKKPGLSTSGGTSDARFIHTYCPVVELGLKNATIHQVNEHTPVEDLKKLQAIYLKCLEAAEKSFSV